MKLALNGATIMRAPLADDVEIAAEAGFDALEIWAGKLGAYLRDHTLDVLRDRMRELDIAPSCINSIEDITFRDRAGAEALIAETQRLAAVARRIGAPAIIVVPGQRPHGAGPRESVSASIEALRAMSDAAGDVRLAFEFLGKPGCAVPTLDLALEAVAAADRPNVGLVIDTFHFYAGDSRFADLDHVPMEQLDVVHLNGCEDRPKPALTDAHRLYPGEGVIPSAAILRRLRGRGFDGTISIEIFRPEYWEDDPRAVARTAHAKAHEVLAEAGVTSFDNS